MQAELTSEQQQLQRVAQDIGSAGRSLARELLEDGDAATAEPMNRALFDAFDGLGVPVEAGGAGGSSLDLALVVFELGRQLAPGAFVPHMLATQMALGAGLDVQLAATGQQRWALAESEGHGRGWGPWTVEVSSETVHGTKPGVPHGHDADAVVLVGRGGEVALTEPARRTVRQLLDPTRPAADLTFDGPPGQVASGSATAGLLRAAPLLAAELAGVGRGAVELGAAHARTREQFGQVIGSFQGVAHQLADALVGVETAWSLALYACWAVEDGAPDAASAVHLAKARAGDAAVHAAECCGQVHGGIGVTWEADPHLYLRRALTSSAWLGSPSWHAERIGTELLKPGDRDVVHR